MSQPASDARIAAIRAFTRFYTSRLRVLDQRILQSPFSLSEARVLFELGDRQEVSAKEIGTELGLDAGYLSRILQKFDDDRLVMRQPLPSDRRHMRISLTAKGRAAFEGIDRSSHAEVAAMLGELAPSDQHHLTAAMGTIRRLLGRTPAPRATLRDPRPGDIGWVVQSHGALYASEYGFDATFEALVAEITAKFITSYEASREHCWIADLDGAPIGSAFLVRGSDDVAKLRLLLVDPAGRGQGLGKRLVVCTAVRLPSHHAVDAEHPAAGAEDLPECRLRAGAKRTASELRPGSRRRDLGIDPDPLGRGALCLWPP